MSMLIFHRIDLQDGLRRLPKNPREENVKQMEELRSSINAEFSRLEALQHEVSDISANLLTMPEKDDDNDVAAFDDLDEDESDDYNPALNIDPDLAATSDIVPDALRTLTMPSTLKDPDPLHCAVELTLRTQQALRHISALRGAIADKSFQYSHVIRVAPRKSVRTRARSVILKLNHIISFHCRAYTKCRSAIIRLCANDGTLSKFPVLSKRDVQCSSAVLDPNTPGSSSLRLSWIWQIGTAADQRQPHALQECTSDNIFYLIISYFHSPACPLVACPGTEAPLGRRSRARWL
jgi:hypothetical protein